MQTRKLCYRKDDHAMRVIYVAEIGFFPAFIK